MKRIALILAAMAMASPALGASPAWATFGLTDFEVAFVEADGSSAQKAGSHPFAMRTSFGLAYSGEGSEAIVDGKLREAAFDQAAGLIADTMALDVCTTAEFLVEECPLDSVAGVQASSLSNPDFFTFPGAIYNLQPPPGVAARFGWQEQKVPIVIDAGLRQAPPYNAYAATRGVNQTVAVFGSIVELWGVPGAKAHDSLRGTCASFGKVVEDKRIVPTEVGPTCSVGGAPAPFLTLPRSCEGKLNATYEARSWQEPDVWVRGASAAPALSGCSLLPFAPTMSSRATTDSAETSSGLDFSLSFDDVGLKSSAPEARAQSEIEKAVITLPQGVTVNPSIGEGLGVCTLADLGRETLRSRPGEGCPNASKIGTVKVELPIVDEAVEGEVFLAEQDDPGTPAPGAENPFDSLIAFYIVLRNARLGGFVVQPAKVEPDPATGQLVTTVEDIPQIPFSNFEFHFREGQRAPLVSPPACGTYTTEAEFVPRADPSRPVTRFADFQVTRGIGGGPCPVGGVPPFEPGFEAGSLNNNAKSFTPFQMRLTRRDGDQDLTKFAATLPPGVIGKLAGLAKCADPRIAAARLKTGRQELAVPSCPAQAQIGRTLAGAGVGSALTYVPGQLYLAGPYNGAPLSVVSITPALAGPFDAGTVVVRVALRIDPLTAEVTADGAASDPIPHILKGIVLKVRDLRVYVDRPGFVFNPTSCDPSATRATLFGGYLNVFSAADDVPVARESRFQAANCFRLPFKPRLAMRLKGGTRRGAHPSLRAVLRARPNDANVDRAVVTLPRSAFLDQAHIRTICTRVQFAADACPKGARYGFARAFTPVLDEPLQGPVYLRSSNNKLPDFVADLHGLVDVEVVGRIDSNRGGIRATFATVPDAPVSKFVVRMQGGNKGLIVNSRNLCARKSRAKVRLIGQNGKRRELGPVLRPSCSKKRKAKRSAHRRHG